LYSKSSFEITDVSLKFEIKFEERFKFVALFKLFELMASLNEEVLLKWEKWNNLFNLLYCWCYLIKYIYFIFISNINNTIVIFILSSIETFSCKNKRIFKSLIKDKLKWDKPFKNDHLFGAFKSKLLYKKFINNLRIKKESQTKVNIL